MISRIYREIFKRIKLTGLGENVFFVLLKDLVRRSSEEVVVQHAFPYGFDARGNDYCLATSPESEK